MSEHAADLLLDYEGDPAALDKTLQMLPMVPAAMVQGEAAPDYLKHEGHYVARVFGTPPPVQMFTSMVEQQGYCKVLRELPELL